MTALTVLFLFLGCCGNSSDEKGNAPTLSTSSSDGNKPSKKGPSWDYLVDGGECNAAKLVGFREAWYRKNRELGGNVITAYLERVESGITPPPVVCRNQCPINIVRNVGVGPVKFSDDPQEWPEPRQTDRGSTIAFGVYDVDTDIGEGGSKKEVERVTFFIFDFPDNCVVFEGKTVPRSYQIKEVADVFAPCGEKSDDFHPSVICSDGAVTVMNGELQGPLITLKKVPK